MSDFSKITPADAALAMSEGCPFDAVDRLADVAKHKAEYSLDCTEVTWRATSLANRHGLLMEWLAAEVRG